MTEQITVRDTVQRLPRCCAQHDDWPTLSQHLAECFPDVHLVEIVREIRQAKDAVQSATLDDVEALEVAETIVRHNLMLRSGRIEDAARLDPERHSRRWPQ